MSVRRTWTSTPAGTLAVLVLLSVLTACGDDDPVADPPISSAPTSSPTRSPQHESPQKFLRRFYLAERAMENSGNTKPYRKLIQGCASCASLARQVAAYYDKGGFVRWGGLRIATIRPYRSDAKGQTFAVEGTAEPTTYRESSSAETVHLAGGATTELVTILKSGESWRVAGFAKLGSS